MDSTNQTLGAPEDGEFSQHLRCYGSKGLDSVRRTVQRDLQRDSLTSAFAASLYVPAVESDVDPALHVTLGLIPVIYKATV